MEVEGAMDRGSAEQGEVGWDRQAPWVIRRVSQAMISLVWRCWGNGRPRRRLEGRRRILDSVYHFFGMLNLRLYKATSMYFGARMPCSTEACIFFQP